MSITTICAGIKAIGDLLSPTITKAFDPPPAKLDTADLPALYALTGPATHDWEALGDEDAVEERIYRVQVPVLPVGQATPELRESRCRILIPTVRDAFASRPSLGRVSGVQNAVVVGDTGVIILPEYDGQFVGFEVRIRVVEYITRTFASYE